VTEPTPLHREVAEVVRDPDSQITLLNQRVSGVETTLVASRRQTRVRFKVPFDSVRPTDRGSYRRRPLWATTTDHLCRRG
jgi:hypothetical protein